MKALLQFLDMIGTRILYPFLFSILWVQSLLQRIKTANKRPVVHHENPFSGQPVALVALYQKGKIRADTEVLFRALRSAGCYVLAVNTLKLSDPAKLAELCDCYIERPNFGRDFGSYKRGFETARQRGWLKATPRLLMINDSVYCVSDRIDAFVRDMLDTPYEVLGSTENYEIIHHLGSFCISFSNRILNHDRFAAFWRDYRNSDIRPRVIHRGEQALSKTIKRCVSAPSELRILYGTSSFLSRIQSDDDLIDDAIRNARRSTLTGWKRFSVRRTIEDLRTTSLIRGRDYPEDAVLQIDETAPWDRIPVTGLEGIVEIARADLREGETLDPEVVRRTVVSQLTEVFMSGSQIHQNASTLLRMGLAIVKLDGLYRGMFTVHDIQLIAEQLPRHDAEELERLLLERPYGGDTLRGWRRAAFMRGLI